MQAGEFIGKCGEMILFGGLAAATTTRDIIVNIRTRLRAIGILIFSATASKEKDRDAVISYYQRLVDGCLGCHAAFKARVSEVLGAAP